MQTQKKPKDPRGRKRIPKAKRKIMIDGSYKHPDDIDKLGGFKAVRQMLSDTFDNALIKKMLDEAPAQN